MIRSCSLIFLLALCSGCAAEPILVTPRSFERPGRLAFACFDLATGQPAPASNCQLADDGTGDESFALHALITQTSRGEIAAVDLRNNAILDSDVRVPGFTFVPVGEVPSDIVVPAIDPSRTYVANFGSRDIWVLETRAFRTRGENLPPPVAMLPLAAGPMAMALSPDEHTLFVALPDLGEIDQIPIAADGTLGTPVPLTLTVPLAPTPVAAPDPATVTDYGKSCGPMERQLLNPPNIPPRTPVAGTFARPWSLTVDAQSTPPRLLVADTALPIVHVLEIGATGLTELAPIVVGVTTRDIALTPPVPTPAPSGGQLALADVQCGAGGSCNRYLYALDDEDGSVAVIDYTTGAVLPIDVQGARPADRISFESVATSVEVLTPSYGAAPLLCLDDATRSTNAAPDRLHGVFLAVGLADGTVRFVDIYDLDAPCRGGTGGECAFSDVDREIRIRRHRPRIGSFLLVPATIVGAPALVVDGTTLVIGQEGITQSEDAPDMLPILPDASGVATCPPFHVQAFPENGAPLICTLGDPWAAVPQRWTASWEGLIPGTQGGRGSIVGTDFNAFDAAFCDHGVIGADNVAALAATEPESSYVARASAEVGTSGDQLWITAELPPPGAADPCCAALASLDSHGVRRPIAFPIVHADQTHLTLRDSLLGRTDIVEDLLPGCRSLATVASCFGGELVAYEVHSTRSYAVAGDLSGLLHRVVADATAACTVDTTRDPRLFSRALPDPNDDDGSNDIFFANPLVSFRLSAPSIAFRQVDLQFTIGTIAPKLIADIALVPGGRRIGVVPNEIFFSPLDHNLYVLDIAQRGLVELTLDPLTLARSFE